MLATCTSRSTNLLSKLSKVYQTIRMPVHTSQFKLGQLTDNVDLQRFEMPVNEEIAYVEYEKSDETYDLIESLVPEQYSGNGVGKILARKTFDHIISQNQRIKLTCDFLIHFYNQNRDEYKEYVD